MSDSYPRSVVRKPLDPVCFRRTIITLVPLVAAVLRLFRMLGQQRNEVRRTRLNVSPSKLKPADCDWVPVHRIKEALLTRMDQNNALHLAMLGPGYLAITVVEAGLRIACTSLRLADEMANFAFCRWIEAAMPRLLCALRLLPLITHDSAAH